MMGYGSGGVALVLLLCAFGDAGDPQSVERPVGSQPAVWDLPLSAAPLSEPKSALVNFSTAPFPYSGRIPGDDRLFLDVHDGQRRGHTSERGGVLYENPTFSDSRTLIYLPAGFDIQKPAILIVFFHGNRARLERDVVHRQQVPAQVAASRLNAVLVAPQFAVDALDSSAGKFWTFGGFAAFLDEAAEKVASLYGEPRDRKRFEAMPILLVAYSGGYNAAAYALTVGMASQRVIGVILLDSLYGEEDKFADFIADRRDSIFFVSAYSASTKSGNDRLKALLRIRNIHVDPKLHSRLAPGQVSLIAAGDVSHDDFVTHAFVEDPLRDLLSRIADFAR